MPLKLMLELSDDDLDYFRNVMDSCWRRNAQREERDLVDGVRRALRENRKIESTEYVRKRLDDLDMLTSMLEDEEWPLEEEDQQRIKAAISYFAEPNDLVSDAVPGLGFLDDAIMAELVVQDVRDELEGYREFCNFRTEQERLRGKDAHVGRQDWIEEKRRQMFFRIRRRRQERQERRDYASPAAPTDPILRYKY